MGAPRAALTLASVSGFDGDQPADVASESRRSGDPVNVEADLDELFVACSA